MDEKIFNIEVSITTEQGLNCTEMKPATLFEVLQKKDEPQIQMIKPEQQYYLFSEFINVKKRNLGEMENHLIDCIVFDFDIHSEEATGEEVEEFWRVVHRLHEYKFVRYTTHSHSHNKPCFRYILPLSEMLRITNIKAYEAAKLDICPAHDSNCCVWYKTPMATSKNFDGCSIIEFSEEGQLFPTMKLQDLIQKHERKQQQKAEQDRAKMERRERLFAHLDENGDKYRQAQLEGIAAAIDKAARGERDSVSYWAICTLRDKDATDMEIAFVVQRICNGENREIFRDCVLRHKNFFRSLPDL